MKKPNIAIITGTRAEYGILTPVIQAIHQSKKLTLQLLVTGMHLQKNFGNTIKDITFPIAAQVQMYKPNDTPAQSLACATLNFAKAFTKLSPDLILVLGDRLEILAAANAALACQIPLAHLHGGETAPGQWDEQIRHALTKIAHLHFPATKKAAHRIQQMGEPPATIHTVGAPALDTAISFVRVAQRIIRKVRLIAGTNPLLLLHPSVPDDNLEYHRTLTLIDLLQKTFDDTPVIHAIGPNNDPGHRGILRAYSERKVIHLQTSLPQDKYWFAMISSGLLVGNSSSGIIEAASFGIPVINIGDRQAGRERNQNVIDVSWDLQQISAATRKALGDKPFLKKVAKRKNIYGDGHASERILKIVESLPYPLPTLKQFHDY